MNLEKEIPDYAMVPAKEREEHVIQPITKDAVYSPVQITNITEGPKIKVIIEEDILVPDTKPDLKEILIMEGTCQLATREINPSSKGDEYVTLSGELDIQTLYVPEKPDKHCPIISISTKIPFKEQWLSTSSSTVFFSCNVESIEHTVINERKYRVKACLSIETKEYTNTTVNLFEGLADDQLHVLRERVDFSHLALRKKDVLSLKEYISSIADTQPGHILMKNMQVLENYKQITADKMVINGFICLNILYCDKSSINDSTACDNIHQLQERVEFTQFIPLQSTNAISSCNVTFDCNQLKLKIVQHEDGHDIMCLEGDLITYVELFRKIEKDVIVDGYHKEKNFHCDFQETASSILMGSGMGESTVREIFMPEHLASDIESILFTSGQIKEVNSRYEQGKVVTEGVILSKIICMLSGDNCNIVALEEELPFRIVTSIANMTGYENLSHQVHIKDCWSEKINGKQIEFNATLISYIDAYKTTPFKLLINPSFEGTSNQNANSPMVIYCCKDGDTLWQIAKRFKTSKETIMQVNNLEKESLSQGEKLLILK